MQKTKQKQLLAFLSSFVLLASAAPQDIAEIVKMNAPIPQVSIERFAESIKEMQKPTEEIKRFQTIRFRPEEGTLYQDDVRVGKTCGSVVVENGTVRVLSSYAATEAERAAVDETATISLEEAAEKIGCEVRTDKNGNTLVDFPFHSSRVIVKSKSKPNMLNALDMSLSYHNIYVLQFATPADAYAACKKYKAMDSVEYATPDRVVKTCAAEQKPLYEQGVSWGNEAISSTEYCRNLIASGEKLPEITVAVIDTGINYEHSWFEGRIADGGVSFVYSDRELPQDGNGHGTHCSGIVCASTPDNVKILPIAVLDDFGTGYSSDIYCGMMYAVEQNADVVSMSFGGFGEDPMMDEAAKLFAQKDILACAAAGNEMDDSRNYHVANSPDVIVVSAVDSSLELADFSNYGPDICLAAPGVDISSAYHIGTNETISFDGTSMATPYVAACCANVLSATPDLDNETVKSYLYRNAIDLGAPGRDEQYGWGMVNLNDFVFTAEPGCAFPQALTTPGEYDHAVDVELSCETEGVSIYYTLDGTEPTMENGTRYTGEPIHIEKTTVIRAIAVRGEEITRFVEFYYVIGGEEFEHALVIEDGVLKEYRGIKQVLDLSEETSIKAIGANAFSSRPTLMEVTLPSSCKTIGDSAFRNCNLMTVIKAEAVTKIGASAFSGCTSLETATFGVLTEIGESSFKQCANLYEATGFSKLTELPAYAFYNATVTADLYSLEVINEYSLANTFIYDDTVSFYNVKRIAAHGMEGAFTVGASDLDMSNAEELGAYALSSTNFTDYTLPSDLEVIPEGLMMYCMEVESVSAPSVKEVRDYGLAFCPDPLSLVGLTLLDIPTATFDIDFSAITSAGAFAFSGLTVDSDLHFDALMDETAAVYTGISAPKLYLPNVKTIAPTSARTEAEKLLNGICFCSDIVYLKNLERVEDYGIFTANHLVIGDSLTEFSSEVSEYAEMGWTLVGQAGGVAEQAAEELKQKFVEAPAILMQTKAREYECYEPVTLRAAVLSAEHTGRWSELTSDGKTKVLDEEYPRLMVTEPTTKYYSYSILDENGTVVASEALTLKFGEASAPVKTLKLGEQVIHKMAESTKYVYIPKESGKKQILCSNANLSISNNGQVKVIESYLLEYFGSDAFTYDFVAGETYIFELNPVEYSFWNDYAVLLIADESVQKKPIIDGAAYRGDGSSYFYDYEDYSELVVVSPDGALNPETDYEAYTSPMTYNGQSVDYVIGKNDYFGILYNEYTVYRALTEDSKMSSDNKTVTAYFTPEASGEYRFITEISDREESLEVVRQNPYLLTDMDTSMIIATDMELLEMLELERSGDFWGSYTCQLTAGTTYHISSNIYAPEGVEFTVLLTREKKSLYECSIASDFSFDPESGQVTTLAYTITAPDGTELAEDVDYIQKWWYDDPENPTSVISMVIGTGNYVGTYMEWIPYSDEVYSEILLDEPFTAKDADIKQLHLDTCCEIRLADVLDDTGKPLDADYFYVDISNGAQNCGVLSQENDTVRLSAGDYTAIIYINSMNMDLCAMEYTVVLEKVQELKDISDCYYPEYEEYIDYTGEVCKPELTVETTDGKLLEEGVDYEIECPKSVMIGEYEGKIVGIGAYGGTYVFGYSIVKAPSNDEILELKETDNAAEIKTPGQSVTYRFTADSDMTIVQWDTVYPLGMVLRSTDGQSVEGYVDRGLCSQYCAFATDEGTEYTLQLYFKHEYLTGTIPFTVCGAGARDMWDCEIIADTVQSSSDLKYEIRYQDEVLVEGKDYRVKYDANTDGVGNAEYCFVGMGNYYGEISNYFVIYHEALDEYGFSEEEYAYVPVLDEEEQTIMPDYLNQTWLFKLENNQSVDTSYTLNLKEESMFWDYDMPFAADDEDDEYNEDFEFPEEEYEGFDYLMDYVILAYDSEKNFVGPYEMSDSLDVKANDYLYLVVVVDSYDTLLDTSLTLSLGAQKDPDLQFEYVEQDGILYGILFDSEAYIVDVAPDYQGVLLKDEISVEEKVYPVVGIDMTEEVWNELCGSCLFYYEEASDWAEYLLSLGMIGVPLTGVTDVAGDLNCDGFVEEWDAVILNAVISEGKGVLVTEAILEQGDTNNDGVLDVLDVMYILSNTQAVG